MTVKQKAFADLQKHENEDGRENVAFIGLFKLFLSEVSIVGLRYVVTSGNIVRRLVWLLFVLCGVGFMMFQLADRSALQIYFYSNQNRIILLI